MQLFKLCGKRKKLEADSREQFSQDGGEILRKSRSELLNAVQLTAATALGFQRSAVNADTRLVGLSGLDSAAAVHFVELLQKHLKIGQLPATLVFDYPTVGELVDKGLPRFLHGTADDLPLDIPQVAFSSDSDLLISSSSCSLPGAQDLQALWQRLEGGYDEVQEIPLCRWDWTEGIDGIRHGSFLKDVDQFDAEFFRLSPAETAAMDPQQRVLLTTSYSALASSGHDQATLLGSPMSIFVALSNQDWYHRSLSPSDEKTAYTGTGVSAAIGANRLSFTLGLRGSSATIDTACSSSLMAISAAAENLRQPSRHAGPSCRRKIRESVAAACELLLGPNSIALRSAAGMLSPLGRCQTFNATADGYVRGEGSGAMLLTLGDDPSWFGSEVMLCAATTNQDGRSATLTAPNGQAQEDVLLDALWRASLPAASVNFVECHGTGTALGDPIEARALRAVLGREREEKLWLGAGKSFLGHLEAAAGFAGLAKVMCSLQQGAVVPNLHFNVLNPHIDLNNSCLDIPTVVSPVSPIRSHEKGIVAGLSSFGFGGTNAHALLRRNANKSLGGEIGDSKVAMIFTGQGEMRPGVGKELYSKDATFRAAMDRCAQLCTSYLDRGLLDVIFSEDSKKGLMSSALYSFVATFCLQHAMVEMWRTARGVQPLAVLGHSLGDFAAATAAGVMSLEEGLRLVAARGRLLDERCKDLQGLMAAIFAPLSEVQRAMVKYKDLSIAAMNSPSQTVVSGPKVVVEEFVFQHFPGKNKLLSSTYAMHSKLVAGVLEGMKEEIKTENLAVPTVTFVSCMTGSVVKEEVTTAEYWLSHDMDSKPVNFLDAVKTLENVGCSTFLEIGPSPVLAKIAQTFSQVPGRWLTTLESGREETEKILSLSRKMQVAGGTLFPSVPRPAASASTSPCVEPWVKPLFHPLLGKQQLPCQVFTKRLHHFSPNLTPALRLFQQHQVQGEAVLPAASHLLLMAAAYLESRSYMMSHLRNAFVLLQDVSFEQIFPLSELQIEVRNEEEMQVCSTMNGTSKVHARAKDIRLHGGPGAPGAGAMLKHGLAEWQMRCGKDHVNKVESYRTLEQCQLQYGPSFATILSWSSTGEHAIAQLSLAEAEAWEHSLQLLHPGIFDGALQLLILVHVAKYGKAQCLLPFCVDECMIATQPGSKGECWATLQITSSSSTSMVGNVEISSDGMLLVRLTGIHMRSSSQVQDGVPDDVDDNVTYDVIWESSTVTSNGENGHDLKHQKVLLCCHEDRAIDVQRIIPWENCRCVDIKEVEEVLRAGSYDVLFYFAEGDALDSLVDALRLMQAAQRALANGSHFTLLLATERTQPPQLDEKTFDPSHAGLWGLARAARLECDFQIHLLDWEKSIEGDHGANLQQLWNEEECCFREKAVFVPRLQRSEIKPAWPLQLHLPRRGSIAAVEVKPQVVSPMSVPSGLAALLRVAAVALNFRDVLNVMGLYPGDPGPPGLDCSGILANETSSLGPLGTAVFGISFGCLRSYATIKEPKLLIERPTSWSHIDAAALPTVFTTVEVALNEVAKLQAGQRLLVHAGAGGVGLTAVQYALHKGALVYATAGREEKKQYLLEMGVKFVSSSRDGGRFEEELGKHLEDEKIDVVLNSLSHDDFIGRSVNFLREGGVFVEIGKRGIWTPEQMKQRRPDIQYKVIAMDTLCDQEPDRFQTLLARLSHRMQTDWSPLPREVYEGLESCADALSVLRRAEKLGKIVVTVPFRMVTDGAGTYVLSGGTGALGLCVSRRLIEEGANDLVLISSRGVLQDLGLQRSAAEVQLWQCDLASKEAADVLTTHVKAYGGPTVKGVFHLAGRLRDGLLATLLRHDVETTYGCKVNGLLAMQQAFSRVDQWQNLDFLLCFSSTASILGAAGQANYAAANASMDAWTYKYRLSSLMASTVQWGAWLEIGMAAANPSTFKHLAQKGISMELGLAMLSAMLRPVSPTSLVCAKVDWIPFLSKFGAGRPKFFGYMSSNQTPLVTTPARESPLVARGATTLELVKSVASKVIGDLEVDEPLTTAGMDSLSAVELRRKLAEAASSQGSKQFQLPSTVAFDYPTVRALAEYLDQSVPQQFVEAPVEAARRNGAGTAPRTRLVAGEASKLPGAHATDAEAWTIFQQQVDAVTEIPLLRFDVNECFDPTAAGVGFLTYARHASFIDGVDLFDPRFFGISSNEAAAIDPQQRHVLEVAYAACHDAGRSRKELTKKSIGVFVGQCANDWAKTWKERKASTFMGPGTHASIAANRISFCLGLEGVSVTVDTACSSTLVALDMSIQRLGDLEAVLCSGSQLNLIAEPFVAFCNGRLLSPTGRCKTFDATADGFARGEGFGSFFLVKDTAEGACIAGAMSNQDGRSSSLTAPNGPAQQRAITGALKLAGTSGADIAAVECHGTGTSLGDPIEVGALGGTLCVRENPLLLMAGKTNVGHLEGAAGALGLVKCLASLKNLEVPPNVHLAELNLHLDLKQDLLLVPSSKHSLTNSESISPMIGLSSFGFGGTNAHAILAKQKGERHLAGSLDQLTFKPMSFPWSSPVPRLLSYRNKEMMFEVRLDSELIKHQNNVHHQQVISSSLLVAFAMEGCLRHLKTSPASVIQLKAFRMIAPLILPSEYDGQIWLRLSINEQQFQVESRHRFSQQAWQVHCMGRFSTQAPRQSVGTMGSLNILGTAGLRRPAGPAGAQRGPMAESFEVLCRSAERVSDESLEEWNKKATEEGWPLRADLLDMLEDLHMKKGEICARVKLPPNFSAYTVHPELLEIFHLAVQCLAFLGESSKSLSQDLSSITSVAVPSQDIPKGTEFLVLHGRERRYGVSPNSVSSSFTLSVDGGVTVLEVQEFQVRPVTQRQVLSAMNSSACSATSAPSLYEMQWSPGASGRTLQEEGGHWLLLCPGDADLAAGLSEVIEKEKVSQVGKNNSDSESDKESETKMEEDLSPKEEPSEASSESPRSRSKDGQPLTTCKDALPDEELDTFLESFDKIFVIASGTGSSRAIDVLAAALLVLKAKDSKTEIWFVVEGTQAAQLEDLGKASLPYHAGLWGLARCARREQRSSFVGCLEVGCSSGPSSASGIWRRVRSACASQEDGREDELLVRRAAFDTQDSDSDDDDDVERHFARLEETTTKAVGVWPPPVFASHSWFVISGGFGGLGLAMASWLVTQGVTHLALLSRSGKCQDEQAANKLQQLCSDEIKVLTEACDISSQDAVQKAASIMAMDELPVKGVIHAAGLLEDHLIAHMDGSRHLLPVLAPKMDGAVNLHAIFGAMRLDHFMLFSSVAALLGSPGQGNYAAANSFLDSFALHRQARGLTALSLQWGPWAEVGMAAMRGVGGPGFWAPKITAMDALQALGSVLTSRSPAVISITQVNWSILLKRMSALPPTWSNFKNYWEPVEPKETKLETEFDDRKRFGIGGRPDHGPSLAKFRGLGPPGSMAMGLTGLTLGLGPMSLVSGRGGPRMTNEAKEMPKEAKVVSTGSRESSSSESPSEPGSPDITAGRQGL